MITRQLDSEFGHEVTISVEWEAPQNNSEFPLVYIGMWRRGNGDQHMWLSEREAQALKRMLIELLCPKAFDALIEADDSPDDGAWPFSREAIRQLISTDECAGGEQERLCQSCGDWLTKGYERYCAGCYRANEREARDSDRHAQRENAERSGAVEAEGCQSGAEGNRPTITATSQLKRRAG